MRKTFRKTTTLGENVSSVIPTTTIKIKGSKASGIRKDLIAFAGVTSNLSIPFGIKRNISKQPNKFDLNSLELIISHTPNKADA